MMKLIEGTDHEKFIVIVALRKTFLCCFKQLVDALFIIMFKRFVGGCVERVFNLFGARPLHNGDCATVAPLRSADIPVRVVEGSVVPRRVAVGACR